MNNVLTPEELSKTKKKPGSPKKVAIPKRKSQEATENIELHAHYHSNKTSAWVVIAAVTGILNLFGMCMIHFYVYKAENPQPEAPVTESK